MAEVQVPDRDISTRQVGKTTVIEVKTKNVAAHIFAVYLAQLMVVIGVILLVIGMIILVMVNALAGLGIMGLSALIFVGYYYAVTWLGKKSASTVVTVSANGVERKEKIYRLEDIDGVNAFFGNDEIDVIAPDFHTGMEVMKKNHLNKISGNVAILFGGETVDIFANLESHQVERAYHALHDAMLAYGYEKREQN